jgi:two-component system chemotaxis response regulator CheY
MKILVVDDANLARAMLKKILEDNGYKEVLEAANGIEAVDFYQEHRPDLVTMDITMPEMTGLEALKHTRSFDPDAKVVMITAMGQEHLVKEAILSGAKSFIVKPFKEDHVIQTLKKL